jgi:hypothetical protein
MEMQSSQPSASPRIGTRLRRARTHRSPARLPGDPISNERSMRELNRASSTSGPAGPLARRRRASDRAGAAAERRMTGGNDQDTHAGKDRPSTSGTIARRTFAPAKPARGCVTSASPSRPRARLCPARRRRPRHQPFPSILRYLGRRGTCGRAEGAERNGDLGRCRDLR